MDSYQDHIWLRFFPSPLQAVKISSYLFISDKACEDNDDIQISIMYHNACPILAPFLSCFIEMLSRAK